MTCSTSGAPPAPPRARSPATTSRRRSASCGPPRRARAGGPPRRGGVVPRRVRPPARFPRCSPLPMQAPSRHAFSSTTSTTRRSIDTALAAGVGAVMADGSKLPDDENAAFVVEMRRRAGDAAVEAELGHIEGGEDVASAVEAGALTDPEAAVRFVATTELRLPRGLDRQRPRPLCGAAAPRLGSARADRRARRRSALAPRRVGASGRRRPSRRSPSAYAR